MTTSLLVDGRWSGQNGIARYSREILARIPEAKLFTSGPRPWHPLDSLYTSCLLARIKPRVYYSPGYNAPIFGNGSVIFTIHDLIHLHCEENNRKLKALYYDKVVKPAARKARCVVTVSEYSRQEILEWTKLRPEQVVVVYNACNETFSPHGDRHQTGSPYFLYVGAQKLHKNVNRILQAYARSNFNQEVRFLFSGLPSPSTAEHIAKLGLESSVTFIGRVSDAELTSYYRGALALISPSLYEGFGLPVLEAMACGTPVLGSRSTAIPEVAGNAALLVDPNDTDDIANAMQRLAGDSALREQLGSAGVKNASRFSWSRSAAEVRDLLLNDNFASGKTDGRRSCSGTERNAR